MALTFDGRGALLVTGLINGSGAANRVTYWTGTYTLGSDAGLLVDAANDMYIVADDGGIGISNADEKLEFFTAGYAAFTGCTLGVGITTPDGTFHAHTASAGAVTANAGGDEIVAENNAAGGISILVPDSDNANFYFGSPSDNTGALMRWNHDGDLLTIGTGKASAEVSIVSAGIAEAIRIDTNQYCGFNESTPDRRIHAVDISGSTGVIIPIARLESQVSGGAGAAGHGASLELTGETTTTENQSMGIYAARWSVATHASRRARLEMYAAYIGTDVLVGVIEAPAIASPDGNSRGSGAVDFQSSRSGAANVASGDYSTIIGGLDGTASGTYSCVLAGSTCTASGNNSAVIGGLSNVASGTYSIVVGGGNNTADGNYSLAAGWKADTNGFGGVFIWADSTNVAFTADRANQFKVRANGGVAFVTTSSTAAIPVAEFNQADVDEPFHKFVGDAAAATLTRDLVDDGDVTTATLVGWYKIEIQDDGNQITDGDYYVPFYSLV